MVRIKFFGAAGEVTGSSFLLMGESARILVDMGMFQGMGGFDKNADESLLAHDLDAVVVTHAHLDHCGRLPLLIKTGFKGKIYANKPTIDLAYLVLKDSAKIARGNAEEDGRMALYKEEDVEQVMNHFEIVEYGQWKEISKGVKIKLFDAGHIMGSSSVVVQIDGREVVFSGDLGNVPSTIVKQTDPPDSGEVVLLESTYGDTTHPPREAEMQKILDCIEEVERTGGTLLMPAFSLERTQELLLLMDHLKREKKVSERLIVYLDSPMGLRATAIYEKYPELFNEELTSQRKWDDPFDFPGLVLIEKGEQSRAIDKTSGAKIIIAGSGMMSGGRIVFHARRWLPDPKTILLFTGFQAQGTLGREISSGETKVVVEGLVVDVRAKIEQIKSMSAHADQGQLMDWLSKVKGVKKVILIHGEDDARIVLKAQIEKEMKGIEVVMPYLKDEVEV